MPTLQNAFALLIGIANYKYINPLPAVVLNDVRDVYDTLVNPDVCGYPSSNVTLLLEDKATRNGILTALGDLAQKTNNQSTIFIYISSHGGRIENGSYTGEYLLPFDVVCSNSESIAKTSISSEQLTQTINSIAGRKFVVIFDCCHASGIGHLKDLGGSELKSGLSNDLYNMLASGHGRVVLASSRSDEKSWILAGAKNSLFTQHLLAGLKGGAPGGGGLIRIFDLFSYIQPLVTRDQPNQHPVFKAELEENFAIALRMGGKNLSAVSSPINFDDNYSYDVFVSYCRQDKAWVDKMLIPSIEDAGIKVFSSHRNFRLGVPLVTEMARAVEESRYTLAILSSAYLQSDFATLENVLAEHLGLEKSRRKLLAVMREECTPRLSIRARFWLSMTTDDEFQENIERLIYDLRSPAE
jgi:hypothetical protein